MTDQPKKYRTRKQVAERYSVTERTISRWIEDTALEFPAPMLVNGRLFFDDDGLTEWERRRARKVAASTRSTSEREAA